MVDSVRSALQESADDERDDACAINQNKQQQHGQSTKYDGGEILNYELVVGNSDDSEYEEEGDPDEISDSDDDLREAEARLARLKKQQKLLAKQTKRERIAKETEEVEKSLKKMQKSAAKKGKKIITASSLRAMDDVVEEVDWLMDQKMKIKTVL